MHKPDTDPTKLCHVAADLKANRVAASHRQPGCELVLLLKDIRYLRMPILSSIMRSSNIRYAPSSCRHVWRFYCLESLLEVPHSLRRGWNWQNSASVPGFSK